jgi:osmoprotectant transport system permease protein
MNLDWAWLSRNAFDGTNIAALLGEHALLAIVPVVAALLAAIPLGYLVFRTGRAANSILAVFGVIYSIPSLALFVALPLILSTSILSPLNVAVALAIYSVALLVRSVVDGLRSVPDQVKQSATAVGYGWFARLVRVELPLAMPVIFAGLRVATVSNIALVSVAAVVGGGALGKLFDRGLASRFYTPLIVGLVLSVLLALLADALILLLQRNTLPWARGGRPA